MNRIIIASHGKLAEGMKNTVEFFGGNNVDYLEQTMTDTGFEKKVIELFHKYKDDNVIVFTDLYGGSVNQCFFWNVYLQMMKLMMSLLETLLKHQNVNSVI